MNQICSHPITDCSLHLDKRWRKGSGAGSGMRGRERSDERRKGRQGEREPVEVLYWDRDKSSFPGLDFRVILSVHERLKRYTAQSRFVRSHFHFQLYRILD